MSEATRKRTTKPAREREISLYKPKSRNLRKIKVSEALTAVLPKSITHEGDATGAGKARKSLMRENGNPRVFFSRGEKREREGWGWGPGVKEKREGGLRFSNREKERDKDGRVLKKRLL